MRPLVPDDLGPLAELHARAFGSDRDPRETTSFLDDVFFAHPWWNDSFPPLKRVDADGRLVGGLGAMPRPMTFDGEPVVVNVCHNFMVAPGHRSGLAAVQLMRAMMRRGADAMICEANEAGRRIAEPLGAEVLQTRSKRWLRILRPTELALHLAGVDKLPPLAGRALRGVGSALDAAATALPGTPVGAPEPDGADGAIAPALLAELVERWTRDARLRPVYTEESVAWLLVTLANSRRDQTLRARVAREGPGGSPIGWYVYYSRPGGIGRVLQIGAAPAARGRLLDRLFADALARGNVAVAGQLEPQWADDLSARHCFVRPGRSWFLAHTRDPEIRSTLDSNEAYLGRLEGEGWLRFGF